ncbi:MAG: hypothetical protein HGA25_06950, partial [Clostridiales bacterium]|nr:hypothetical protein [Clostridiales bacterium]
MKRLLTKKYFFHLALMLFFSCFLFGCGSKENTSVIVIDETITANGSLSEEPSEMDTQNAMNLLTNGTFDENLLSWELYSENENAATISIADQKMVIHVTDFESAENTIQVYYDGLPLSNGNTYQLSFTMSATTPCNVGVKIQLNGGDYQSYLEDEIPLTVNMEDFTYEFTMKKDNPSARLSFQLGTISLPDSLDNCDITLDNVSLLLVNGDNTILTAGQSSEGVNINTSQVGYLPKDYKTAVFRYESAGGSFYVLD